MSTLHQIYCTHCTYGTSAMERNQGELAKRPLGYGARAASLQGNELRKQYGRVQRFLYYYLPNDTPGDLKRKLTAHDAPRRLFFQPSTQGLQLAGQICYRTYDSSGHSPGSYFGHVLYREADSNGEAITARDCLRLWNSPYWVSEDRADLNHDLTSLSSLADLKRGPISDALLQSLVSLRCTDPAGVIPPNVRAWPVDERRKLLQWALGAFLSVDPRSQSVILLAEPSLAALVFYGVLRLLPDNLTANISFSTFEKPPERPDERYLATLVGTRFHDPAKALASDLYKRYWIANTFGDRLHYEREPTAKLYAAKVMEWLSEEGFQAVENRLRLFTQLAPDVADLEGLVKADDHINKVLDPSLAAVSLHPRDFGEHGEDYLRLAVGARLSDRSQRALLSSVLNTPVHARLLKLLATNQKPDGAVAYLLERLPTDQMNLILELPIPEEDKVEAILKAISDQHGLPKCLAAKLEQMASQTNPLPVLFPKVMARLNDESMAKVWNSLPAGKAQEAFLDGFHHLKVGTFKGGVLEKILADWPEDQLRLYFIKDKGNILRHCSPELKELAEVLEGVLYRLPETGPEIWHWLTVLRYACKQAPNLEKGVAAWESVQQSLKELVAAENIKEGWISGKGKEDKCREAALRLVDDFLEALKATDLKRAEREKKVECLERLTKQALPENTYFYREVIQEVVRRKFEDPEERKPAFAPLNQDGTADFNLGKAAAATPSRRYAPATKTSLGFDHNSGRSLLTVILTFAGIGTIVAASVVGIKVWQGRSSTQAAANLPLTKPTPTLPNNPEFTRQPSLEGASAPGGETKSQTPPVKPMLEGSLLSQQVQDQTIDAGRSKQFKYRIRRTNVTDPIAFTLVPEWKQGGQPWRVEYSKEPLSQSPREELFEFTVFAPRYLDQNERMTLKMTFSAPGIAQPMTDSVTIEAWARHMVELKDIPQSKAIKPGESCDLTIEMRRWGGFTGEVAVRFDQLDSIELECRPPGVPNFIKLNSPIVILSKSESRLELRLRVSDKTLLGKKVIRILVLEPLLNAGPPVEWPSPRELTLLIEKPLLKYAGFGMTQEEINDYKEKSSKLKELEKAKPRNEDEIRAARNALTPLQNKVNMEVGDVRTLVVSCTRILVQNTDPKVSSAICDTLKQLSKDLEDPNLWADGLKAAQMSLKNSIFSRSEQYVTELQLDLIDLLEKEKFADVAQKLMKGQAYPFKQGLVDIQRLILHRQHVFRTRTQEATDELVKKLKPLMAKGVPD